MDKSDERLYDALYASQSLSGHEADLRRFLVRQLARYEREPEKGEEIAYHIAGLMATPAIMHLPDDDPYDEVLSMAGQLELPPAHRSKDATWERFAQLVNALPK